MDLSHENSGFETDDGEEIEDEVYATQDSFKEQLAFEEDSDSMV